MIRILKLKPLSLSVESTSHQFVQRCFAGGTPKGKARLQAAGPLKRQKVATKKGGAAPAGKGGARGGSSEKQKIEELYDRCLNAPAPIRHLTAKERAREVERAKLGLVSQDRKQEMEMLKIDREKLGVSEKPGIIGTPGLDLITLGVVDAEQIPKYELTAEDGKRLAKEYSRVLMRQHRAKQAAESMLRKMKKAAIEALPEHLKAAALMPDPTPAPPDRYIVTVTPPIEGFMEKMRDATMAGGGRQKIR